MREHVEVETWKKWKNIDIEMKLNFLLEPLRFRVLFSKARSRFFFKSFLDYLSVHTNCNLKTLKKNFSFLIKEYLVQSSE